MNPSELGPRRARRVGSYQQAIEWIACNDDTDFLDDEEEGLESVTLCLVADVFGRTTEEAIKDLRAAVATQAKEPVVARPRFTP